MKTAPIEVTLVGHFGSDLNVVNAARVSFAKESSWEYVDLPGGHPASPTAVLSARDVKLINYLAKHKHTSPFNHTFLSFRVKAPIFVARQLVKHKFMPFNEVSRRYVTDEPEFYFPDTWRGKPVDKKQGSSEKTISTLTHLDLGTNEFWESPIDASVHNHTEATISMYDDMLESGVAPEQARMVLPQNTMTEWVWSGTLGAVCDMLRLRLGEDTQEETRQVATLISKEVKLLFPVSYAALLENV